MKTIKPKEPSNEVAPTGQKGATRKTRPSTALANRIIAGNAVKTMKEESGRKRTMTEEQSDNALEWLAAGITMREITSALNITRSALLSRANQNADFAKKLYNAMEMGQHARVDDAMDMAMGGELSTGSIERDKLAIDLVRWVAARLARRTFGERPLIEAGQMTVVLRSDADDIC